MKTRRETKYRVEYRSFGIWRKMDTFDTMDEAYEYVQDQEYFDTKEGLKHTPYRVRPVKVRVRKTDPADYVFRAGYSPHGCYLFEDGTFGYIGDPEFDPEEFLEEDMEESDLYLNGRRPIGNLYIDRWTKDGEFIQGGCFIYYEGERMRDYCDRNGEPHPVREIPEEVIEMFESGDFSNLKMLQKKVPELKGKKM